MATASAVSLPRRYNAVTHFIDRHLDEGRGGKVAFIDDQGPHTYGELAGRVNQTARALRSLGVEPEQRVLMCMLDDIDFPAVFFGAMKLGAVPVPVNTMLTTEDFRFLIDDSRARAVIVSSALFAKIDPATTNQPHLRHVLVAGEDTRGGTSLHEALAQESDAPVEPFATTPDDVAFWLYSSGSTGQPKGVLHLMRDLVNTAVLYGEGVLDISESDMVFSAAKLFFAYGLGNAMTFPLHAGATAVLMAERPTPDAVAAVFEAHRPSVFYGVPTLYGALLAGDKTLATDRLRTCVSAGEALPADLFERWKTRYGVEILDGLGSTELLHIFLSNLKNESRPGSSGLPVPGYQLRIVDDRDNDVANGELGELLVSGPTAAPAYWNNRDRSLATFEGAWTRTGDKYTRDADGYYYYRGRTDDMLKVGGIWVSPFEVESALSSHEAVLEAAVVGHQDDAGLTKPKAFVVARPGTTPSDDLADILRRYVKNRLAPYKYPRWIEFVGSLPKTATGKVRRFALRARPD
jgi:4-hydroxybenzoate-CoA ligase/benzoate-CoA ligase